MIDFHCHILPGMDDGSRNSRESIALLDLEAEQGIRTVVLTPHFYAFENSPEEFLQRRQQAWQRLQRRRSPPELTLLLGAEVLYFEGICRTSSLEKLRIQGTQLLLLEMPMCRWTQRMLSDVLELNRRQGFRVILAHVERYLHLQKKDTLEKLLNAGVLFQANVSFFASWKTRAKAVSMMKKGQIHLLGSDCHREDTRRPNWDKLPDKALPLHRQAANILRRWAWEQKEPVPL